MRQARLALVLGIEVEPAQVRRIFDGLELEVVRQTRSRVTVMPPSWRSDLTREIDLIEEVARIHGYDEISETTRIPVAITPMSPRQRCERTVRRLLAGAGFNEVMTYSQVTDTPIQRMQPWHEGGPIALRNPLSSDRTHLRLTNMPSLLDVKRFNASHGIERVDLFELGKVYLPLSDSPDGLPLEKVCLTALTDRDEGFFILKGVLDNVLEVLHVDGQLAEEPAPVGPFSAEESLVLRLDGALLGCVGILRKDLADQFDLSARPALMEVDFDLLVQKARIEPAVQPVPRYPAVARDIAVIVDESVRWADLRRCILDSAPPMLESLEFFDIYRGEQIPPGKKSIAFCVTLRSADRTLTSEEADAARSQIVSALQQRLGGQAR
jgi:phenylalanyl-tRNA synthetase beta chain